MESPSSSSSDGPTAEELGAKEYVEKVSYYKALIREGEGLQRHLLKVARLLDEHKNDTKRVKKLEDDKASHERRLNQVNHWQGKTKSRMEWLRGQCGWFSQDKAIVLSMEVLKFANLVR